MMQQCKESTCPYLGVKSVALNAQAGCRSWTFSLAGMLSDKVCLTRERLYFARYADDIIILVKSKSIGNKVKTEVSRYISKRLKLIVNETKSRVGPASGSKFLGFTFQRGRIKIHAKSLKLFKEKVKDLTNRNWGIVMKKKIHKLNLFLRGWGNYFLIANAYQLTVDLSKHT